MRFSPAEATVHDSRGLGKERIIERERNARAAALRMNACGDEQTFTASALPSSARHCVILQMPNISIARTAEMVRTCSMQQGGGSCDMMVVQADGQVLQFSVAAVAQLLPLHKSKHAAALFCVARADGARLQVLSNTRRQASAARG
jgi:hypothetical protein